MRLDPASEVPRLGPIEILREHVASILIKKVNCPKACKAITLDFSRVQLILKLLYINIWSYPAMFCAFLSYVVKPPDKKGDID